MATIYDYEAIKRAMNETKNVDRPWLSWVGQISISYSKYQHRWLANLPNSDATIIFDDVRYSSNSIYFMHMGTDIAYITHAGLTI